MLIPVDSRTLICQKIQDIGNQDINEEEQDEQSRKEDPTWTPEEADNIYTKTGDDDNEESAKPR